MSKTEEILKRRADRFGISIKELIERDKEFARKPLEWHELTYEEYIKVLTDG